MAGSPLAQTFKVEKNPEVTTAGRFLTSVDVYFGAKDDTLPVSVEIRNVVNGYPGNKILPYSRVVKNAADINVSSTGATATTFTFPSPVYVSTETEYAIAVLSNTPNHKVWITRMGDVDIGGTRTVSKQPHVGVLYKSHNGTEFAMSPMEDMKFSIKAAEFDTTADGIVTLVNDVVPTVTLARDAILMDESTTLKIRHQDHHMYATSNNVTIDGVVSGASTTLNGSITTASTTLTLTSGTNFADTSGKYSKTAGNLWYLKIDDEIMTYTTITSTAVSGLTRGVGGTTAAAHTDAATVLLYQVHKVPLTEINKTHTSIANPEIDSYTVTLSTTPVTDTANAVSELGGTAITATENAIMDYMQTIVGSLEFQNTRITSKATLTSATSPSGTQTSFTSGRNNTTAVPIVPFPLNDNYKFESPRMVASAINEQNELASLKSYETQLTLTSQTSDISPVIDMERASLLTVSNRINDIDTSADIYPTTDYVSSELTEGDQNAAIYVTKQVTLENLATSLKVIFSAHRPATSEIKVMYKILGADESVDFQSLGYRYFNDDGSPDTTQQPSADVNDFQDYIYTAGVTDDGIGDTLPDFIAFQIKIIMQGTNCAEPPRIREFRTMALAT